MGRTIPGGTTIRIRRGSDVPRAGDVIAFEARGQLVTHRVVARGRGVRARGYLVTRGDGGRVCDAPVPVGQVLGVVTATQSAGGWTAVPTSPGHAGWDGLVTTVLDLSVRAALELDPHLAAALVHAARRVGRASNWLARRLPGGRLSANRAAR